MSSYNNVHCILLDIEGTTTSISFVKDVLFPYVRKNIENFIVEHWKEPGIYSDIEALQQQSEVDVNAGLKDAKLIPRLPADPTAQEIAAFQRAVVDNVLWQMSCDRKTTALKQLQGHMWAVSYVNKEVCGHIYDDVPTAMRKWKKESKKMYIYSSGSVEAQKLLFGHSIYGNILEFIDGYFDTNIGQKSNSKSYKNILERVGMNGKEVLFLTDVPTEAYAAEEAGLNVCLVVREGNAVLSDKEKERFQCISSFADLELL